MVVSNALAGIPDRFPALQHRDFRVVWFGMFFASATMMFQFYAQGWFVVSLTSSVALLGVLGHAVVILALLVLRVRAKPDPSDTTLLRSIGEGVSYSAGQPSVLWIILINLFIGVLGFPIISTLAPYWMRHELGLGAVGWTMMGWGWGLGTVISSVALSAWKLDGHFGRLFIVSAAGFALSLVAFGLTRSIPVAALFWGLNGTFFTAN